MTASSILEVIGNPLGAADVKRLAKEVPTERLFEYIFDTDSHVARNAAWVLTHKPTHELMPLPPERLVDMTLTTPNTSLRRLTLALIERRGIKEEDLRTDFLDFCLQHMMMLDEPTGVQALCLKLAHQMCSFYPELMREFGETLHLMQPEDYKPGMRHLIKKVKKEIQR